MRKSGCYKPTSLKWISSPRFRRIKKETWKLYFQLFFSFPSSLFLGVARAQKICRNPFGFDDKCGSSVRILRISIESQLLSPSGVSRFWLVGIPMTLPQSGWLTNHSKSFIRFSYVICAFTYHIAELVHVLSYIQSRVWGSIKYSGTQCGEYYLIPRRLTTLIRWKILDSVVNMVSEALSMHVVPLAIRIVMAL
jgi:hypothetical protein